MGKAADLGVPGAEGAGERFGGWRWLSMAPNDARCPNSGGAGLLEETRFAGRSILDIRECREGCSRVE